MSARLHWALALALLLAGAALLLAEAHDIWQARAFWRGMRAMQGPPVPDYWDSRYVTAELTLASPKIVAGALLALAGLALAALRLPWRPRLSLRRRQEG